MRTLTKRRLIKNKKCENCGSTHHLTIDHIIPKCWGGKLTPHNRQVLCYDCNWRKGVLPIIFSTKTIIIHVNMFLLDSEDRELLFSNPNKFGCELNNPGRRLYKKYKGILV